MWLEYILSIAQDSSGLFKLFAVISCIGIYASGALWFDTYTNTAKRIGFISVFFMIPFLVMAMVPKPSTLLKTRITLLGFHALSEKNVSKGLDHVMKVTKQLECKYLDLCDKGEEK